VKYKGVTDVLKHLYKEGGLRSIFRGTGATLARDGPGSAAYFAAYEVTKKALTPAGASAADLNLQAVILAGGTAGVAMWAIAIPPDVSPLYSPSFSVQVLSRARTPNLGPQISSPIRTHWHILWHPRLCAQDDCG